MLAIPFLLHFHSTMEKCDSTVCLCMCVYYNIHVRRWHCRARMRQSPQALHRIACSPTSPDHQSSTKTARPHKEPLSGIQQQASHKEAERWRYGSERGWWGSRRSGEEQAGGICRRQHHANSGCRASRNWRCVYVCVVYWSLRLKP